MMDPNVYVERHYGPTGCWLLVQDVIRSETGREVNSYRTVNNSVRAIGRVFGESLRKNADGLAQLLIPADLCIVLMGKSPRMGVHHAGVYWRGSVLHALDDGVYFQDLASMRDSYGLMEFWGMPA